MVRNGIDVSGHAQAGRIPKIGHQAALSCELSPNVAIVVETSPARAPSMPGLEERSTNGAAHRETDGEERALGALRVGDPSSA